MLFLKANTAVDVLIGPFVDDTDGKTAETGLTISQADIKLSKNGQALAQKNDSTAASADANGYYNCELDATDTNTEGNLVLVVNESGALPVRHEFNILSEAAFDSMFAAKDSGYMDVNIKAVSEDTTAADNCEAFFDGTGYAGTNNVIPTVTTLTGHTAQTGDSFARIGATGSGLTTLATQASVNTIDDYIDTEVAALTSELAKVPKSDGTATWNATALAAIETQCDDAITANTLILDIPTNAELASAVANVSVDEIQASALADLFNTDSGTDYASAVEGSVVSEIVDNAGGSALTAGGIADAVWDEVLDVAHEDAGSASVLLQGAGSAGDPWTTALPGAYGAGTAGKIIGDNINAPLSTIDTVVDGIQTDLSNGTDGLGALKTLIDACSTHSAADVWSVATRVLTAGTNLEDLSAADVAAELETYDAVKRSEATTDTGTITTAIASAFTEIKGATWSDTTDTLEHIRNKQTDIETDTAEIGIAGAGLTAINLPNQTMNITGNLSGSVGSVMDGVTLADNAITSAKYDESTAFPLTAVNGSTLTEAGGTGDQFIGIPKTGYSLAADQSTVTIGTVTNLTNAPTSGDLTATMKASVNTEVDTALNTAIPATPTADSINEYIQHMKYVMLNKTTITKTTGTSEILKDNDSTIYATVVGAYAEDATTVIRKRLE